MPIRVVSLHAHRGPPVRLAVTVELDDPPFNGRTTVEITDAATIANVAGAGVFGRILTEVNTKLPGRGVI